MSVRRNHREWWTLIGSYVLGLFVALGVFALWIVFAPGAEPSFNVGAPAGQVAPPEGGLIGSTYADIASRLRAERRTIRRGRTDLTFRVERIVWQDRARPDFLRAAEMRGRIDTRALQVGDIVVRGVAIRDVDVLLEQNADKQWNYKRVMATLFEREEQAGPRRTFLVTDIGIRNADIRVRMPERVFAIKAIAAQLPRAEFTAPGLTAPRVNIARATGSLVVADSSYELVAEDTRLDFPAGRAEFNVQRLTTRGTTLANVSGALGADIPGFGIRVRGDVDHMRFEDVRFLSKRLPGTGTATFQFRFEPVSEMVTVVELTKARLETQASKVSGSATIHLLKDAIVLDAIDARFDPIAMSLLEDVLGDTLPYRGTITGTARGDNGLITFDVDTRLTGRATREPLTAHLTGSARLASNQIEIRRVDADLQSVGLASLRSFLPGLPLKGTISGRIALTGPPRRAPLNLNVRLELANGIALVEGTLDLTDTIPAYDLRGRLIAVDLQQLMEPAVPPVFVTARFSAVGAGVDPRTAQARAELDGKFSGWRTTPRDSMHAVVRLSGGALSVESGSLQLATLTASARGQWRFVAPASGSVEYRVAFEPVTPFGPYIPVIGDEDANGNVRAAGSIAGETGRIQVGGTASASNLRFDDWSASSLDGTFSLVIGPAVPEITFEGGARDLTTPTAGAYRTATAKLNLKSPVFALEIRADRAQGGGGVDVFADGTIPPTGAREVVLRRARIDFGNANWALSGPAMIAWAKPRADALVKNFEMRKSDGNGMVRLDGRVLPLANADFRLETVALPVGDIQRLLGRQPSVSGALSTTTTIHAIDGVPQLATRFDLNAAIIEGVRFSQLAGDATYEGDHLIANATAIVDTAGMLRLSADLPISLKLGEGGGARLLQSGPVRVTLFSDSIALAPFATLSPDIQSLTGSLSADVTVSGTVEEPQMGGVLAVRNASVRVIPLNQRFDSIHAVVTLENRRATIQDFVVRSGGLAHATGTIEFEDLTKPVLDIAATLDRLHLMGVENQNDAAATGQVQVTGPVSGATLRGAIVLDDGYVPIPQTGTRTLDAELARFEADLPTDEKGRQTPSFYRSLTIDGLKVTAGDNLWFAMEDARAQLAGVLTIHKNGDDLSVVGELEGERGTYTMRAGPIIRRFDVLSANIRFLGGRDINPALDITARRRVIDINGRQIDIDVRIRGTMERPTLALASADAATIPQSDLLSFLLFGQPSFALGGGSVVPPEELVGGTYLGGIAELLSMELEQAVVDQMGMGLDIFQIRLGGGRLSNFDRASLVVGEEVGRNVFLTVESGVETLFGSATGTATPTFALRLEWRASERTNVRASYEPLNRAGVLRGFSATTPLLPTTRNAVYQASIELRRRWTW